MGNFAENLNLGNRFCPPPEFAKLLVVGPLYQLWLSFIYAVVLSIIASVWKFTLGVFNFM